MSRKKGISFDEIQQLPVEDSKIRLWKELCQEFSFLEYFDDLKFHTEIELKKMFGGLAIYHRNLLSLILMDSPLDYRYKNKKSDFPIWYGVLVVTDYQRHDSLKKIIPELINHPVLPKWLYLRKTDRKFSNHCGVLSGLLRKDTPLIGVEKKKKRFPLKPRSKIPNLGPKTTAELKHIGIENYDSFLKRGWMRVWKDLVEHFPNRKNLNMGRALYGAANRKFWNQLSAKDLKVIKSFRQRCWG